MHANTATTLAIVLAAGQGKRMKTHLPKVAHTLLGKPMILHTLDSLFAGGVRDCVVVLSPHQEAVVQILEEATLPSDAHIQIAYQETPLGTGHATQCGFSSVGKAKTPPQNVIVAFGDTPAVRGETFSRFLAFHQTGAHAFSLMAFDTQNPTGYGRVVLDEKQRFIAIREHKDCNSTELAITLCNSGFLCGTYEYFVEYLPKLECTNQAHEYYLTDLPGLASQANLSVGVFVGPDEIEFAGVNSQQQLATIAARLQTRLIDHWLEQGVQFLNPEAVYLEPSITFDPGVIVEPFVYLSGKAHFTAGSRIRAGSRLHNGLEK